jgi:hypothetical protein
MLTPVPEAPGGDIKIVIQAMRLAGLKKALYRAFFMLDMYLYVFYISVAL